MGVRFASTKKALGLCDVCGFTYKLRTLRTVFRKGQDTNILACSTCWDKDHPQLRQGEYPVYDPQALRNPRPDFASFAQERAIITPTTPVFCVGAVGSVTVVT